MKVKSIQFKNGYKRFHDLTIDLGNTPKRIIALVGPNGCGKSSVFDGMLYHNGAYSQIGNKGGKGFEYHSMNLNPQYNFQNISIEFDKGNYEVVRNLKRSIGKENTIFSFRSPYRYNSNLKVSETRAISELKLNNYGASTSIDLDDKMDYNYRRLQIKYNTFLNENDSRPSEAKQIIMGDLNNALRNCLDLKIVSLGDIQDGKGSLYFEKDDHPKPFEFNVLSSGEKEVVDILLDLYLRQEEYNDSIYLIDEPELHINTSIQKKLLLEINKLIPPDCQIWVATHSIGFLRALQDKLIDDCQIIEFKNGTNYGSTKCMLSPIKNTRLNWKNIFETALDDLTGLIAPKRIIYCEGKDKPGTNGREKGFDAKVFNNIFSENYQDTIFVSSGGNTELDQRSDIALAILTKIFSDIEILVLKDRDISSGKFTSVEDRETYLLNNPNNHRVLMRWEIENYLFDKEVLKKYCSQHSLVFDEQEYDKYFNDIDNQNIKDEIGRIKNICGITTSINSEKFKLNLSEIITDDMAIYSQLEKCIF